MGGFLVIKLVKPTKVFCSCTPYQGGCGEILPTQTEPNIRAATARVLRKTNAAVREELGGLNPVDSVFDDVSEFFPLLLGDRGSQILDFDLPFPHEYY
ncbi:MAG: hypothetical protein WAK56_01020, partial [Candidatus Sulfotelmatobacter sp.]